MKYIFIGCIRFYQICIRPCLGAAPMCRFSPSCSQYALEALQKYGPLKGSWLAVKRICKCGPWHCGGHDPIL